jgi:diguanylate cyclase (GGDEF)-like protein
MDAYNLKVNEAIILRLRIVMITGCILFIVFNILDRLVYPAFAEAYLGKRMVISAGLFLCFLVTYLPQVYKRGIWIADISVLVAAGGILALIAPLPDPAASNYYQGLHPVVLAMFTMNSFYIMHNIFIGLIILSFYVVTVTLGTGFTAANIPYIASALFFMGSTFIFVTILTRIFSESYYRDFLNTQQLHQLSMNDSLTKLYNRRGFLLLTEERLQIAKRRQSDLMLFFADMDGLKVINDNYGHAEGDQAILDVAEILRKSFRETDILARFAGDEFAILTDKMGRESEQIFRTRVQEAVDEFNARKTQRYFLSLSMGSIHFKVSETTTIEAVMVEADKKLYQLKRTKSNGASARAGKRKAA